MENIEDMEWGQPDRLNVREGTELPEALLEEIFEKLSNADLMNLSLVNKVWNCETRRVLRKRGSWTAKMNTDDGRCKALRNFASDLRQMKEVRNRTIVPFSGLTIAITGADDQHGGWCEESSAGELDEIYEDILRLMDWELLAVDLRRHSVEGENCAGFQLVKKILQNRFRSLEELSLKIRSKREAKKFCIQKLIEDCNFFRLRTLKFEGLGCEALIKALVSRARNLKVLHTKGPVDSCANLLEGSSAEHVVDSPFGIPRNQ